MTNKYLDKIASAYLTHEETEDLSQGYSGPRTQLGSAVIGAAGGGILANFLVRHRLAAPIGAIALAGANVYARRARNARLEELMANENKSEAVSTYLKSRV